MIDEFKLKDNKIKIIIFIATTYAFLCAILYLYSFWSRFHINFLEFITLSDLIIVSLYPIVGTLLSIVIGFFGSNVIPDKKEISKKHFKLRLIYGNLSIIFITLLYALRLGWYQLFLFTPFLIALWFSFPLEKYLLSKNIRVAGNYLMFIILIPLLSYGTGAIKSYEILNNINVRYAVTSQFQNNRVFKNQSKIKYIGFGGKQYFFISKDNSNLYIINSEKIGLLELSKQSSEKLESPWEKLKKHFNEDSE